MYPANLITFLENFADLLEIRGNEDDKFSILAYRRAAEVLHDHEGEIFTLINEGKLHTLQGIGKKIEEKAKELMETGKVREYEKLTKKVPASLLDILKVPFLGPKKAAVLFKKLKVKDIPSLKKALISGKVEKLPGFGKRTAEKFLEGLVTLAKFQGRTLLGHAFPIVEELLKELRRCKDITTMEVAGSLRRREETIGDIDILITAKNAARAAAFVASMENVERILGKGPTKVSVLLTTGLQVDVRIIDPSCFGAALQYFTGSKAHNIELRSLAKEKGYKISEYGIFQMKQSASSTRDLRGKTGNTREIFVGGKTEEEIYATLGMDMIPPELRQANGEIEAALRHKLPRLITTDDIKGDLHVHSTWSDGRNSIEEMARAAEKSGLKYVCISDHSPGLGITQGPKKKEDLLRRKEEIEAAQKKVKIRILSGTEVDIRADGSLDYPDDLLALFDIVIASIHSGLEKDNTARLLRAMDHPLVHAIGHPTGRLLPSRKSYSLDEEAIYKKAAETGTWLEINGQPTRMDLSATMFRKAKEAGVKFLISSDAHTVKEIAFRDFAVSVARRGWLEKGDVVNTMPLKQFLEQLTSH